MLSEHNVKACVESFTAFGDDYTGSISFDEYNHLAYNYRDGMVVDSVTACSTLVSSRLYQIGLQVNLIDRSTGATLTGTYHGLGQADYPSQSVDCSTVTLFGTVIEVRFGARSHYADRRTKAINYMSFTDDVGTVAEFGNFVDATSGW